VVFPLAAGEQPAAAGLGGQLAEQRDVGGDPGPGQRPAMTARNTQRIDVRQHLGRVGPDGGQLVGDQTGRVAGQDGAEQLQFAGPIEVNRALADAGPPATPFSVMPPILYS